MKRIPPPTGAELLNRLPAILDPDHVRAHSPEDAAASDDQIIARLLDPENARPANPHPLFDCAFYSKAAGVRGGNPILHYLHSADPVSPHPLMDHDFYRERLWAEHREIALRPLEHYLEDGAERGIDPSPYFSSEAHAATDGAPHDGLAGYLARGPARVSPHGIVDLAAFRHLFNRDDDVPDDPAIALATDPAAVPMEVTPVLDPVYYSGQVKDCGTEPHEVRDHYFRIGLRKGLAPNGLISRAYVMNQFADRTVWPEVYQFYLNNWLHTRPRLLLAIDRLDNSAVVASWLAVLERLLDYRGLETIVLMRHWSPLGDAFRRVAHVWNLAAHTPRPDDLSRLEPGFRRLMRILGTNKPRLAICRVKDDAHLFRLVHPHAGTCAAFADPASILLDVQDRDYVARHADAVLDSVPEDSPASIGAVLGEAPDPIHGFFCAPLSTQRKGVDCAGRDAILERFGLPEETMLVLASGLSEFDAGIDFFANVIAQVLTVTAPSLPVHFLWFDGHRRPNSPPLKFAQHRLRVAGVVDRFTHLDGGELQPYLEVADLYVNLATRPDVSEDVFRAIGRGVPVLSLNTHPLLSELGETGAIRLVEEYDLEGAANALVELLGDPDRSARNAVRAREALVSGHSPERMTSRLIDLLPVAGFPLDAGFVAGGDPMERRLVVIDSRVLALEIVPRLDATDFAMILGEEAPEFEDSLPCPSRRFEAPETALERSFRWFETSPGWTRLTIVGRVGWLEQADLDSWGQKLWYLPGGTSDLDDLYRHGGAFDGIRVLDPAAIDRIAGLNSTIAARMEAIGKD